ncbi:MAG: DNA recombination protein RmuC [Opitutales bacterium]|jgi:DNA recombination protein RmuC|nr:DNA recombination protein RmuC [Opitutales bacterium]
METIITCLVVVCSAIGLGIFLHQRNPGTSPEDSARAAELIARVVRDDISKETERLRAAQAQQASELRKELTDGLRDSRVEVVAALAESRKESAKSVADFSAATALKTVELQKNVEKALELMRADNERRLNEMREVVGEKLQKTLEARLGESFKQVSDRLDTVSKGLVEVQQITSNINDLKRVMGNVKTRGVWGETFLESLLSDSLVPEKQYVKNFRPKERSGDTVEFAIILPGNEDGPVYLPVDSKFPREDYDRIVAAAEVGDSAALLQAQKDLAASVLGFATDITKYINPPRTTDFAILFLPTEGLYAEVLRFPGIEKTLKEKRIVVAGPSTMMALIHSLRVGFQTLVVQKKSAEIAKLLGAVKKDFGNFGDLLEKINKKLEEASSVVTDAADRQRKIAKKMTKVAELPDAEARLLLNLDGTEEGEDAENPPA